MHKLALVLSLLSYPGVAQRPFRSLGSVKIVVESDAIELQRGTRQWRIEVGRLPIRTTDCAHSRERKLCDTRSRGSSCTECAGEPSIVAWDDNHSNLYFAVPTETSKNKSWILFRYNLRTRRSTRLVNDYGGGFGLGQVSRSGQYLAYVQFAVMGVCGTSGSLMIADLWAGRLHEIRETTSSQDEIPVVESIHWKSPNEVEIEGAVHRESECRSSENFPKRSFRRTVNTSELP